MRQHTPPTLADWAIMINYTKIHASQLAKVCRSGERMVDVGSAMYNSGRERHPHEVNNVTFDHLNGLSVDAWENAAVQAIQGLTLDVRRGRMAAEMAEAASGASSFIAVTTERLLILDGLSDPEGPHIGFSARLSDVAVLKHDPRLPLEIGRILVGFRDGSLMRLWMGLVLPVAARRFAASFTRAAHR